MEEELEAAITAENYDLAAQLGLETDALRAETALALPAADGEALLELWKEQVMRSASFPACLVPFCGLCLTPHA